ncbi:alpha amylase C-terminal domain-containing protein, partial [Candidatus Saccharibacteria bacterium]|nr:alpha amylase C-terminal domain-containing protein [Candidatus Saccharibacteria bacterium]
IYFYNDPRGDTPWGGRPDYGRPEVRQFILDNVTMWLNEYHLDGLRVDSTIYMRNTEGVDNDPPHDIPDAWYLLQDIVELAHKVKPGATIIAEDCANSAYLTKPRSESGCAFDAQWELGFPHALRDALGLRGGRTLAGIRYELERTYNGNAFEKVVFSDSHDTAANGSVRLNEAAGGNDAADLFARERALIANALMLTAPGVPMLLQGQEFMQEGAFNDWQELEWDKAEKFNGIVQAHRHLIDLRLNRHGNTAGLLGQSTAIFHQDDDNGVIAFHRWNEGGPADDTLVIANFGDQTHDVYQLQLPIQGTWHIRFNSSWTGYSPDFHEIDIKDIETDENNVATIQLPRFGVYVLSQG